MIHKPLRWSDLQITPLTAGDLPLTCLWIRREGWGAIPTASKTRWSLASTCKNPNPKLARSFLLKSLDNILVFHLEDSSLKCHLIKIR